MDGQDEGVKSLLGDKHRITAATQWLLPKTGIMQLLRLLTDSKTYAGRVTWKQEPLCEVQCSARCHVTGQGTQAHLDLQVSSIGLGCLLSCSGSTIPLHFALQLLNGGSHVALVLTQRRKLLLLLADYLGQGLHLPAHGLHTHAITSATVCAPLTSNDLIRYRTR